MTPIDIPITMTSKGTFTLPAKVRKDFGLKNQGDKLMLRYIPGSGTAELKAPLDLEALQDEIAALIPDELYNKPFDIEEMRHQKHIASHHDSLA